MSDVRLMESWVGGFSACTDTPHRAVLREAVDHTPLARVILDDGDVVVHQAEALDRERVDPHERERFIDLVVGSLAIGGRGNFGIV